MTGPSVVAGLVLLIVVSVVDAQTCTSDTCVIAVENQRTQLQQNITLRTISLTACQNVSAIIASAVTACRTSTNCPNTTISVLSQRLTNVTTYLQTACAVTTTCNSTQLATAQTSISACQPTAFRQLAINNVTSRINICISVQAAIDCITAAAAPCLSSVETAANFELLYDIYLGLWFDCQLTVRGAPVVNNVGPICSYPTFAKCYNPVLRALGRRTIDDNFDYNYLNSGSGFNASQLFDYTLQSSICSNLSSINWNTLTSCVQTASVNCGEALGESASIPLGSLEPIWDDIFQSFTVNLKYLEQMKDLCSPGCSNINTRKITTAQCLDPSTPANNVLNSAFKSDITSLCSTLNTSINCINNGASGCNLLKEDIYWNYLNGNAAVKIQTASYLCGIRLTANLPWERCRNKQAAAAAANIELQCTSPGLMLKSVTATPGVNNIMTSIQNMFACSQWLCWQNELVYITKLYPFAAIMQTTYNSTIVPKLGTVSVNNLKGANCDIRGYMQCFSPILNVVGAKFVNGTSLGWLLPMSALLSGSPSDIQPLCSNLTQIDWNAMINCAEGRWASTCSTPLINVQGGSTTTLGRGVSKFYLTDLRAMRTWVSSICMPNCSGVVFGISAQQIVQCVYNGGSNSRILDQSRLALLASFLGQPIGPYCTNLSQVANCLQTINGGCTYLDNIRDQLTASAQYNIAYTMCFPTTTTAATTVNGGGNNGGGGSGSGDGSTTVSGGGSGSSGGSGGSGGSGATTRGTDKATDGGNRRVSQHPLGVVLVGFVLSSLAARIFSLH